MITVARAPSVAAANATPCAWLPALAATTPRSRSASVSLLIRTYAPRGLNEPVRCRFSHFRNTGPDSRSDRTRECSTGVAETIPRSSFLAAATSSGRTSGIVVMRAVSHPDAAASSRAASRSIAGPVPVSREDQRRGPDQPRALAQRGGHHGHVPGVVEPRVRTQRLFQRLEQQRPGLGKPAADRDHLHIAQLDRGGDGDAK